MVGMYIVKGGKRILSKHTDDAAEKLLRSGKAKTPEKVMEDLDAAIQKLTKPGIKVVVPSGSRKAKPLPTKEANALIKRGEAQAGSTVLTQLRKAVKQTQTKKAGKSGRQTKKAGKSERIAYDFTKRDTKIIDHEKAFKEAIAKGLDPERMMYMHTDMKTGKHFFKHKDTRKTKSYAGGGPLRTSKQIMNPRPIKKPKGVGASTKGWGKTGKH